MGYYTQFSIEIPDRPDMEEDVVASVERHAGYNPFHESCKWYRRKEHLAAVSEEFPDLLIVVDGVGEENGDVWRAFFLGGKSQIHRPPIWTPPDAPIESMWD